MSRNKIPEKDKRKSRSIPFSDKEWDQIKNAAKQKNLRPSNFIQMIVLNSIKKHQSKK